MLHLLLEARKNEQGNNKDKKLDITDEEIVAQAMIFFLGGFETVSTSLCFAVYELAIHEDIQKRLYQEIEEVWKETEGKPSFEDISKMKYLDMVISGKPHHVNCLVLISKLLLFFVENLRKNPPMIMVDRKTVRPYTFEPINKKECALTLEAGSNCLYSVCSLHWDPNYFPNPMKFDPERFSEENKHNIVPGSYIPFGVGPRVCIGKIFWIQC